MIRHLGQADFTVMPWANGKGQTVEMLRIADAAGLLLRLSRAAVVEDGDFSSFPGIDRNLTVIAGPGFDLVGPGRLVAAPYVPVAFAGDVAIRAEGVSGPCEDFNVMLRRGVLVADVSVVRGGGASGDVAVFALEAQVVAGRQVQPWDLVLADEAVSFAGRVIRVGLQGLVRGWVKA